VRPPRSIADELGGYLAGRPHHPDARVFTLPLGAPLRWSKWGKAYFTPALRAAGLPDETAGGCGGGGGIRTQRRAASPSEVMTVNGR
jgi:hypothetical protein